MLLQERRYDARRGMSLLVEDWVSRASALQRRGRAGRVRPGMCWTLCTRPRFEHRMRRYQVCGALSMPFSRPAWIMDFHGMLVTQKAQWLRLYFLQRALRLHGHGRCASVQGLLRTQCLKPVEHARGQALVVCGAGT